MDFRVLARLLEACVADFRDALLDKLPAFAASNPTAENVARTVHERLEARLPRGSPGGGPRLVRTTVWEAERLQRHLPAGAVSGEERSF